MRYSQANKGPRRPGTTNAAHLPVRGEGGEAEGQAGAPACAAAGSEMVGALGRRKMRVPQQTSAFERAPMKLDRALQHEMLTRLAEHYPNSWTDFHKHFPRGDADANVHYLEEHGLVVRMESQLGRARIVGSPQITAQGMDFLADDGGLSAVLGVVTIRLHDDTIKSLIEGRILESELPPPEKQRYLDRLRELPAETTKHLVLKLVDLGLEKGPAAIAAIGSFLSRQPG